MNFKLRPYQDTLRRKVQTAWQSVRSVLMQLSTGGGKTVIFSSLMHDHNGAAIAVAHRKEIITQISLALAALGVKHRIVAPRKTVTRINRRHLKKFGRSFLDRRALHGVASVQTLTSAAAGRDDQLQKWLNQITLAVFDEGHHYTQAGIWGRAVEIFHRAKLLFVTATPERADGQGLGSAFDGFADTMVEGPTTQWLIDNGYLCPFRYVSPRTDFTMDGETVGKTGDFSNQAMRRKVVESHLVGDTVSHYLNHAAGKRTIVFATDVSTAYELQDRFLAAGVRAQALDGSTDAGERDNTLDQFETGGLDVLINVDLFDEGFDVPAVEAVVMARPTESLAKYLQMVGRALRIMEGKEYASIIDAVRNWERHGGLPNLPRSWTLAPRPKGSRRGGDDTIPQRICAGCAQVFPAYLVACPYQVMPDCSKELPPGPRAQPDQVDGDLFELDVEALTALYAQMAAADMTDEEYTADLVRRNVPHIGRAAAMKRHRTAKHRRQVLRELVGWWIGMQPDGRDMREKHRRFFHRFGVDIGTAFTLDLNKTDALIETIKRRFSEDMTI